jgi:hypothetical protein
VNTIFFIGIVTIYFSCLVTHFSNSDDIDSDNDSDNDNDDSDSDDNDSNNITNIIKKIPINYNEKYIDKFNKLIDIDITKESLDNLKNTITMENTPNGNVIMFWDNNRETFTYYSDGTIPYHYLEVVSRKYVIENNCKKLYIVMKDEIIIAEQKIEKEKEKEREKEKENEKEREKENENENENEKKTVEEKDHKRDIFAKFKNYNKDSKYSTISIDNKNLNKSTPKPSNIIVKPNEHKVIKEKANRYSCEGKLINFSFLKKVDKKIVDKKYSIKFSDYKLNLSK